MDPRREVTKRQILLDRGPLGNPGAMLCELCHKAPGTDLHEIASRGQVWGEAARDILYRSPELCALLCNKCNRDYADTDWARHILWAQNVARYGRAAVQAKLDALQAVLDYGLGIVLPEVDHERRVHQSRE